MPKRFPSDDDIKNMSENLSRGPASKPLAPDAGNIERIKYYLCQEFVAYVKSEGISQVELADELGVDQAIVSKIVRFHTESITVDRLIRYLEIIRPGKSISIQVA